MGVPLKGSDTGFYKGIWADVLWIVRTVLIGFGGGGRGVL